MAARRVLILILAVLVVSTVGTALLAPRPDSVPEDETTTTTAAQAPNDAESGRLIEKTVQSTSRRPRTVRMRLGDQLELTVRTREPAQVEIPRLGLIEDAAPDAPAHFSILPPDPEKLVVRVDGGGTVAVIRVAK
jgi:hypothetical protein